MTKTKVPKRVGGVKIPKNVRKQAKQALALVDTPAVRDLAIAGLTIAAEKLVERKGDGGEDLKLGDMLRESAIEGARRFLAGFEEARRDAEKPAPTRRAAPTRAKATGRGRRRASPVVPA